MKRLFAILLCLAMLAGIGSMTVSAENDLRIVSFSVVDGTIIAGTPGNELSTTFIAKLSDGSKVTGETWDLWEYGLDYWYFDGMPDVSTLTPGSYSFPVRMHLIDETELTADFSLTVLENPVASIQFPVKEYIHGFDQNFDADEDGRITQRYYRVPWPLSEDFTITLKNGKVFTSYYDFVDFFWNTYHFEPAGYDGDWVEDVDSMGWNVGDVCHYRVTWCGVSGTIEIHVVDSPLQEVRIVPAQLNVPSDCYYSALEGRIDCYFYGMIAMNSDVLCAVWNDGTKLDLPAYLEEGNMMPYEIEIIDNGVRYEPNGYQVFHAIQPGDTVNLVINCLGRECEFSVTFMPFVIAGITAKPLVVWEGENVVPWVRGENVDPNDTPYEPNPYYTEYTVTFTDGTRSTLLGANLRDEEFQTLFLQKTAGNIVPGEGFFDSIYTDAYNIQNENGTFTRGQNALHIYLLGKCVDAVCEVVECPVEQIDVETQTCSEPIANYHVEISDPQIHVTFKDGSEFTGTSWTFYSLYHHNVYENAYYLQMEEAWSAGEHSYDLWIGTCKAVGKVILLPIPRFSDVKAGSYYEDAVLWATYLGITSGTDETHFSPKQDCNRAQVVTFLWNYAGQPEPDMDDNPFVDLREGAFYFKAVLWAYQCGITSGTDETHFSPKGKCTRAQVVTFLWNFADVPPHNYGDLPFVDVPEGKFYTDAVRWAVYWNITSGTDETHFSPKDICNRAQVVTFLYNFSINW